MDLAELSQLTESPMEQLLLEALWDVRAMSTPNNITAQVPIGPYRVDFHLLYEDRGVESLKDKPATRLLVEVDGHDYHERTKEQAIRDKQRDRFFLGLGLRTARFTGAEVYTDPKDCAEEAWSLVMGDWYEIRPIRGWA